MEPERIVYVSCDSATLARDLKILCEEKYELKAWQCYDQFSRTVHVETVALLSKLSEAKHHINVKLDMDELDVTTAETKTTYNEIRDWVKDKYGFNVTNLNIAQVKRKYGITEQENHRKSKYQDKKQQGTPDEKIKAIEDAMRHLQMI
ncbi:MAG: 23S rRNA (uracil(1939)-C(5))-methyltransferase RlmD, partial [Lachnospiraceae bacterium]|nr:23S rRNA (uracil(1939)-C(5))-methyltransferase RlmD [Lachnospiraceae bacterium]